MINLEETIRVGQPEGIKHLQVDIGPVFENGEAFEQAAEDMYQMFEREVFDYVVTIDSNGFAFASIVANRMHKPLYMVGTNHNLLREMISETIETHHGTTVYSAPKGILKEGQRVIIIGDILSHGKDVLAAVRIINAQGAKLIKIGMFIEYSDFKARKELLRGIPLQSRIITADL